MNLTNQEVSWLLAGLRLLQNTALNEGTKNLNNVSDIINYDSSDYEGINALCERINFNQVSEAAEKKSENDRIFIQMDGGLVTDVFTDNKSLDALNVIVVNYDTEDGEQEDLVGILQPDGRVRTAYIHMDKVNLKDEGSKFHIDVSQFNQYLPGRHYG